MAGQEQQPLVRRARLEDLETLVGYNRAMAKETENLDLPLEVVTKGVREVLEGRAGAYYWVLEVQGKVEGQLMITTEWSDWRASWVWWIQSVYVEPHARQRGHFKRLYQHVRAEAEKEGAAGLRLYADDGNTRAHATYERLGMSSHYKVFEDMFTHY